MQQHGLDTVFHMEGVAADGTGGKELFTHHTRYSKEAVDAHIKNPNCFSDDHSKTALKESAEWLLNSLDESLKTSLRSVIAKRPSGPQLWMAIVREVQANSIRRCKLIVKEFEKLSLLQFKGENVDEYCTKANELLTQLEKDNRLPETHLVDILDHLSVCSVMEFKVPWLGRRKEIEDFIDEANGKDEAVVLTLPNYIHFSDLLEEAKQMYVNLQHLWGPAKNVVSETQSLKAALKAMKSQLDTLNQELKSTREKGGSNNGSGGGSGGGNGNNGASDGKAPKGKCWRCGGNHLRKDCKQPPGKEEDGKKSPTDKGMWDHPKAGEPQEKTINGKVWKFCAKCKFKGQSGKWTRTHSTAEHKDKPAPAEAGGANLAGASVEQHLFSLADWTS